MIRYQTALYFVCIQGIGQYSRYDGHLLTVCLCCGFPFQQCNRRAHVGELREMV